MRLYLVLFLFTFIIRSTWAEEVADRRTTVYDGDGIVELAKKYMGIPYKYGGQTPDGFDCSGFTKYVFMKGGFKLARGADDQYAELKPIKVPRAGDLVFFKIDGDKVSHVGIYLGHLKFIHSPSTGKTVSIADMKIPYWKERYAGARTVYDAPKSAATAGE